jgi:hypothetical protein
MSPGFVFLTVYPFQPLNDIDSSGDDSSLEGSRNIPHSSEPLIPPIAFDCRVVDSERPNDSFDEEADVTASRLLVCLGCNVCVHASKSFFQSFDVLL